MAKQWLKHATRKHYEAFYIVTDLNYGGHIMEDISNKKALYSMLHILSWSLRLELEYSAGCKKFSNSTMAKQWLKHATRKHFIALYIWTDLI